MKDFKTFSSVDEAKDNNVKDVYSKVDVDKVLKHIVIKLKRAIKNVIESDEEVINVVSDAVTAAEKKANLDLNNSEFSKVEKLVLNYCMNSTTVERLLGIKV